MLIDDGVAWITVAIAVSNVSWSMDLSWLLWCSWLLLISVVHLAEVWSILTHFRPLLRHFWSVWSVAHLWSLNELTHILSVRVRAHRSLLSH